jgi:LysR family glycine cleavage system transcriptional activator
MNRRLPSLNALRAFEAAARHLSLTKAARELHVTPAAVSHQIKALEADLGLPLMHRVKGGFVLSEAAKAGLPGLRDAFDRLHEAVRGMRLEEVSRILTVSAAPSFAATWLVPRLDRFKQRYPEIDVRLDASFGMVDFLHDNVDVAVRYGPGDYAGLHAVRLFDEEMFPVCSPLLLERGPPLSEPRDLARHNLLHSDWTPEKGVWPDWRMWLLAAGAEEVDSDRGPRFTQQSIALQAAVQGQGVALGSPALVADDLAAGRLAKPFDLSVPVDFCYFVVAPPATAELPRVRAFRNWLVAEAAGP